MSTTPGLKCLEMNLLSHRNIIGHARNCFGKDAAVVEGSPEDDSSGDVTSSDSMESEVEASA